ncbi:MAG: hypothetical protein LBF94_01000 [Puniceicoccales bacterium]|jgi:biotin synthase|nr:hypothetical protein [Puniceicoccales bacterium]
MKTTFKEAMEIFAWPFFRLIRIAHDTHRQNFNEQAVQISEILSVKTGGCSEDCAYYAQSIRNAKNDNAAENMDILRKWTLAILRQRENQINQLSQ